MKNKMVIIPALFMTVFLAMSVLVAKVNNDYETQQAQRLEALIQEYQNGKDSN